MLLIWRWIDSRVSTYTAAVLKSGLEIGLFLSRFLALGFSAIESIETGMLGSWWNDPHGGGALGKRILLEDSLILENQYDFII